MADKQRGTGGKINLSIGDYYEAFLKDHPEVNASGEFRRRLDTLIDQKGWTWSEEEGEAEETADNPDQPASNNNSASSAQTTAQTND